jgi:hypothetical protein
LWKKKYGNPDKDTDKDESHNCHEPNILIKNCMCKNFELKNNEHLKSCKFAKDFRKNFIEPLLPMELQLDFDLEKKKHKFTTIEVYKICCCMPEIPHDETQKLKLIEQNFDIEE